VAGRPGTLADAPLVGREAELERLDDLVARIGQGTRMVVLRGEAGIGKTALWRIALRRHRAAGHRVLTARAAEDELPAPMLALADLFDGVDVDDVVLGPDTGPYDRGPRRPG
jgi:hypothetical protein